MKKALFTIVAIMTSMLAMSQFYAFKDGFVVYGTATSVDSVTFCCNTYKFYKDGTENGHDYVDLGLTSGTLWATTDVGATSLYSSRSGSYFHWGSAMKEHLMSSNAIHLCPYRDASGLYNKYNYNGKYGHVDNKTTLDAEDDAAHINWGGKWVMPDSSQCKELIDECYWVKTNNYNSTNKGGYIVYKAKSNADKGVLVSDSAMSSSYTLNDAHIFIQTGTRWSSSLSLTNPSGAIAIEGREIYEKPRYGKYRVRAVLHANQ